jgi:hypothetical protein
MIDRPFSNFNFYILVNILLGVGMLHSYIGVFPRKEGGIQLLAGLAKQ